jgi:hypothetical protein
MTQFQATRVAAAATCVAMVAGQRHSYQTEARMRTQAQCLVGASVLWVDEPNNRFGNAYGVVLNEALPRPSSAISGDDGQGNPTIDFMSK